MTENHRDSHENATRMREVSHTNPYTNESMGSLFEHGVTVVADGGRRDAVDADAEASADADGNEPFDDPDAEAAEPVDDPDAEATEPVDDPDAEATEPFDDADAEGTPMKEVSHEAPDGGHGNRMFERVGDTTDVTEE